MAIHTHFDKQLAERARRAAKQILSSRILHPYYRRVGRRFSRVYHHLGRYTWEGNTSWMGVGAEKLPLDLWVVQEIIVQTRPELLIETGVRRGGSTLFYAHIFDLLREGQVLGIDIDLGFVKQQVSAHPRVTLIETDSGGPKAVATARRMSAGRRCMVVLDSDHSKAHVLRELAALAPLVSEGCYLIVEDTNLNSHLTLFQPGSGPLQALDEWLPHHPEFELDRSREKFLATFNPRGYLRRRALDGTTHRMEPSVDDRLTACE